MTMMITMTTLSAPRRVLLLILFSLASTVRAAEELNQARFDELTKSGRNGMIKFFQPWCGHCTRMKPDWDKLADAAHSSVFIADVNCSDQDELCQSNEVQGYPTIKVYKDGAVEDYSGGRGFDDLMEYVDSNLAAKCDIAKIDENCSSKAPAYVEKWKGKDVLDIHKESQRLTSMLGQPMSKDLKAWLRERISILGQLAPPPPAATKESEDQDL
jgi:protein disulfide-isomerase-like protein